MKQQQKKPQKIPNLPSFSKPLIVKKPRKILEASAQVTLVRWLREHGIRHCLLNNPFRVTSWGQLHKAKAMGLNKGMPDLLVYLSDKQTKDGKNYLIFVEMKKEKGGVVTPEQQEWIDVLNTVDGCKAMVSRGHEEALSFIFNHMK